MAFLKGVKDEVVVNVKAVVSGDFGTKITIPFKARYKRLKVADAKILMDKVKDDGMTDEEMINEVLVGWSDMRGADDQNVEYGPEALAEAMSVMGYRKALVEGFINQQFEIDSKNR